MVRVHLEECEWPELLADRIPLRPRCSFHPISAPARHGSAASMHVRGHGLYPSLPSQTVSLPDAQHPGCPQRCWPEPSRHRSPLPAVRALRPAGPSGSLGAARESQLRRCRRARARPPLALPNFDDRRTLGSRQRSGAGLSAAPPSLEATPLRCVPRGHRRARAFCPQGLRHPSAGWWRGCARANSIHRCCPASGCSLGLQSRSDQPRPGRCPPSGPSAAAR